MNPRLPAAPSASMVPVALPLGFRSSLERQQAMRLPPLPGIARKPEITSRQPDTVQQAALDCLISAACYLIYSQPGRYSAAPEAAQILTDLSYRLMREALAHGLELHAAADQAWKNKRDRWERHRSVEVAIRYIKAAPEVRSISVPKPPGSLWGRWWKALREPAQVQPF